MFGELKVQIISFYIGYVLQWCPKYTFFGKIYVPKLQPVDMVKLHCDTFPFILHYKESEVSTWDLLIDTSSQDTNTDCVN